MSVLYPAEAFLSSKGNCKGAHRRIAREKGLSTFVTGRPCRRGHVGPHYVSTGQCVECVKFLSQRWYAVNKDKAREKCRAWRTAHPDKMYASVKNWIENNRQHNTFLTNRRRAAKLRAMPDWVDRDALKAVYEKCPKGRVVDHIIPLQNGKVCGLHVPWNLQYITKSQNSRKGNKLWALS